MGSPAFAPHLPLAGFTGDGDYGSDTGDGYAEEGYGGYLGAYFILPQYHVGSDDLTRTDHIRVGEVAHRRDGILLGTRKYATRYVWKVVYTALATSYLISFKYFFDVRIFRLLPDHLDESTYYVVHWVEPEFHPISLRGNWWKFEFTIEQSPG